MLHACVLNGERVHRREGEHWPRDLGDRGSVLERHNV